jgi:hypothetical protein
MKLKKSAKTKWLKALRSGKYEQGKGALNNSVTCYDEQGFATLRTETQYCCLGVACAIGITRPSREDGEISTGWVTKTFLDKPTQKHLADMNDNGQSFKKIAAWISKKL